MHDQDIGWWLYEWLNFMITPWSWQSLNGWCKRVARCKSWSVHDHSMIRIMITFMIMIIIADLHDNVLLWLLWLAISFTTCSGDIWVTIYHMVIIVYWKPGSRCKTHVCQLELWLWKIVGLPMPNFAKNGNSWALSGNSDVVWLWDNNHVHSWSCCDHVMIMHDHIMIRIGLLYILLLWLTHDHDHDHALGMITAWSWSCNFVQFSPS